MPRRFAPIFVTLWLFAGQSVIAAQSQTPTIDSVSISRPFFNPTLNQKVRIAFAVGSSGTLSILVLDRDGFVVRKLASGQAVRAGQTAFEWDGRDAQGTVVPDEAYSLKIDLLAGSKRSCYFPASLPVEDFEIEANYYDRRRATLSYTLPKAARVHIQAGTATVKPQSKETTGPVLKTIANREPRPAGAVIDYWDGYDESGTIHVPSLPHFVVGIAATTLPANSILTSGNRAVRFVDTVADRRGKSLLSKALPGHHHQGLSTLADVAPALHLTPQNAVWSPRDRLWILDGDSLRLSTELHGPSAAEFEGQPIHLLIFVDEKPIKRINHQANTEVSIPMKNFASGVHVVALNWTSDYGPTAVNSLRVRVTEKTAAVR